MNVCTYRSTRYSTFQRVYQVRSNCIYMYVCMYVYVWMYAYIVPQEQKTTVLFNEFIRFAVIACMYVCMYTYECMYVCIRINVCIYRSTGAKKNNSTFPWVYQVRSIRTYVCMYVCMYVYVWYMHVSFHKIQFFSTSLSGQ